MPLVYDPDQPGLPFRRTSPFSDVVAVHGANNSVVPLVAAMSTYPHVVNGGYQDYMGMGLQQSMDLVRSLYDIWGNLEKFKVKPTASVRATRRTGNPAPNVPKERVPMLPYLSQQTALGQQLMPSTQMPTNPVGGAGAVTAPDEALINVPQQMPAPVQVPAKPWWERFVDWYRSNIPRNAPMPQSAVPQGLLPQGLLPQPIKPLHEQFNDWYRPYTEFNLQRQTTPMGGAGAATAPGEVPAIRVPPPVPVAPDIAPSRLPTPVPVAPDIAPSHLPTSIPDSWSLWQRDIDTMNVMAAARAAIYNSLSPEARVRINQFDFPSLGYTVMPDGSVIPMAVG